MHATLDALLVESRRHPDDDMPRLVLADWLEENGGEAGLARAEFIRIQCQLPRTRGWLRSDLQWRERNLWWTHVENWLGPIYDACTGFEFQRGLAAINIDAEQLVGSDLDSLFACPHWAWVDCLHLTDPPARMLSCLSRSPASARLRVLQVEGGQPLCDDDDGLAECVRLDLLQELVIRRAGLSERGAAFLACCPSLTALVSLDVSDTCLNSAALEAIGRAPALTALTTLEVGGAPVCDDHTAAALAAYQGFLHGPLAGHLTRLGIARTGMLGAELAALVGSPMLGNLEEIDLSGNRLDDNAAILLASSAGTKKLKRLVLCDNDIDEAGVAALAHSPHLASLEALDLAGNVASAGMIQALVEAPHWWEIKQMRLGRVRLNARQRGALRARYGSALDLI
jgi:uncharacterized protein (TIGR02996 family)